MTATPPTGNVQRRFPAVLVVRHIRKAIGAPGATAAAVGVSVGLILGLALAAAVVLASRRTEC
ncbi:hypothetical protein [Streptomyces inusitatus]|uniref:hypothetical protein n=1 Tax=Streptomyces inusitatus TaxID=68221 RepID=UPI00167C47F7|nr:hypothetical protein [Streptomyces inusitatus]